MIIERPRCWLPERSKAGRQLSWGRAGEGVAREARCTKANWTQHGKPSAAPESLRVVAPDATLLAHFSVPLRWHRQ